MAFAVRRSALLARASQQAAMPIVAGKIISHTVRAALEREGGGWVLLPGENGEGEQ